MKTFRHILRVAAFCRQKANFSCETKIVAKEVQIPVPWGHIAVKQWGDEKLPLVLCEHGFMDNAGVYDRLIPVLPQRFCYVAIDKPGHGLSSHAAAGLFYYDEFYLHALDYVRRYYGGEKIGLIGHSMGSAQCLYYTHANPKRVRFFVGTELCYFPDNSFSSRTEHLGRRIDKIMKQELSKKNEPVRPLKVFLEGMIYSWGGSIDKSAAEILLKRAVEPVGDQWRLSRDLRCQNNQILGQNTHSLLQPLPTKYDIKMCVIDVTDGMRFAPVYLMRETLKWLAINYGPVEYHFLKGRHHILLTNPDNVSSIITNFLNKVAP